MERHYHQRILQVLIYIQRHLSAEDLTLETLASVACFSPYHFHRIFRALVGESVMAHIRRLRLERAAFRLTITNMPVVHVAFEAGYKTHEAFTRAFRSVFGLSPSQFRHRGVTTSTESPSGVHYAPDSESLDYQPPATGEIEMEVRIEQRPACRVAFVRHTGPYDQCGGAWEKLMAWAGPKGLLGPQTACIGLSYDDPKITPADKIRYDACIGVADSITGEGEIGVQEIAGGDYAITTHAGPYDSLHQTYASFYGQWLPSSGYECQDMPPLEIYLNDPTSTPPAELRTDVCIPVRRI